jgi:hypothetical protein
VPHSASRGSLGGIPPCARHDTTFGVRRKERTWKSAAAVVAVLCALTAVSVNAAAAPASGRAQTLTVVNRAGVDPYQLRSVERAVERQVVEAAGWWHFARIRFSKGGWPVYLMRDRASPGGDWHGSSLAPSPFVGGTSGAGTPFAVIAVARGWRPQWSVAFDHEILEMLADPLTNRYYAGRLIEICDRVAGRDYRDHGISLQDYVLPAWFSPDHRGRLDYLDTLHPAR